MINGKRPCRPANNMHIDDRILIAEITSLLHEGREVEFTPTGNSMRPFIEGGKDSVTLIRSADIDVGDILLCRIEPDIFVLHRLIDIKANCLTLMGDGNLQGTEKCSRTDVIGKVIAIHRADGSNFQPSKARLWVKLLPIRRWLLYIYRKLLTSNIKLLTSNFNESTFRISPETVG